MASPSNGSTRERRFIRALLDELAAERKHIDALEKKVKDLEASNQQLQQTQTAIQSDNSQTHQQVASIQKTLDNELGPQGFGDRINSFFGQHTFSIVANAAAGFAYARLPAKSDATFESLIRLSDYRAGSISMAAFMPKSPRRRDLGGTAAS